LVERLLTAVLPFDEQLRDAFGFLGFGHAGAQRTDAWRARSRAASDVSYFAIVAVRLSWSWRPFTDCVPFARMSARMSTLFRNHSRASRQCPHASLWSFSVAAHWADVVPSAP